MKAFSPQHATDERSLSLRLGLCLEFLLKGNLGLLHSCSLLDDAREPAGLLLALVVLDVGHECPLENSLHVVLGCVNPRANGLKKV